MERKQKTGSGSPGSSAKPSRGKRLSSGVKKFVTDQLTKLANEPQPAGTSRDISHGPFRGSMLGQLDTSLVGQGAEQPGSSLVGQLGSSLVGQGAEQPGSSLVGQLGSSLVGQGAEQPGSSLVGQLGSSLVGQQSGPDQGLQAGASTAGQLGGSLARKLGKSAKKGGLALAGQIGGSLIGQLGADGNPGSALAGQLGSSLLGQLGGGQQGGSLAGQLGSSLIGQLGGGQQGGSLAGQLGGSLLGQLGGGQQGSVLGQLGGLTGGIGGGQRPPAAAGQPGAAAGANPVMSTVACSAVQGLRRAAEAKSIPMKVFWILMVLISVGMFIQGAMDLTMKVRTVQVVRTYHMHKVPFEFPDLYFCPKNSYSGSFPYTLNRSQVDAINRAVDRLSKLYDEQFEASGLDDSSKTKVWSIQQSLPVDLLKDYIMHRPKQSLFYTPMISYYGEVGYETKILPDGLICFKVELTDLERKVLIRRQNQETLRLALFTDPVFPDFKYTGELIEPIYNPRTNETIPFRLWYPSGVIKTIAAGYTMLIVPRGVYPSLEHESKFLLAPGKSYDIDIHMEEHKYSSDLWDTHCSSKQKSAEFVDHLTGQRVEYNYSYDACYYTEFGQHLYKVGGYLQQGFPVAWNLRHSPRWGNLSENAKINRSTMDYGEDLTKAYEIGDPVRVCCRQLPCVQQQYVATFSFHNWPTIGGSYSAAFHETDPETQPAIHQLAHIAKQLEAGQHSTHSEAALRHFIAESMLEVSIRVDSPLAARVLMTASYSGTSYLSDIGGLMGLYLGCSVLTLCEFVELLYAKASTMIRKKCRRGKGSATSGGSGSVDDNDDQDDQDKELQEGNGTNGRRDEAELAPLTSSPHDEATVQLNEAVV